MPSPEKNKAGILQLQLSCKCLLNSTWRTTLYPEPAQPTAFGFVEKSPDGTFTLQSESPFSLSLSPAPSNGGSVNAF